MQSAKNESKTLQAKVDSLQHDLQIASRSFLVTGNPYPMGLGKVRVGEPAAHVKQAYPDAKLDEREQRYLLVKAHPIFEKISFYFNPDSGDKTITHIVLEISDHSQFDKRFLRDKLRDALTLNVERAIDDERISWVKEKSFNVYTEEPYSYMILVDGDRPLWARARH